MDEKKRQYLYAGLGLILILVPVVLLLLPGYPRSLFTFLALLVPEVSGGFLLWTAYQRLRALRGQ